MAVQDCFNEERVRGDKSVRQRHPEFLMTLSVMIVSSHPTIAAKRNVSTGMEGWKAAA